MKTDTKALTQCESHFIHKLFAVDEQITPRVFLCLPPFFFLSQEIFNIASKCFLNISSPLTIDIIYGYYFPLVHFHWNQYIHCQFKLKKFTSIANFLAKFKQLNLIHSCNIYSLFAQNVQKKVSYI